MWKSIVRSLEEWVVYKIESKVTWRGKAGDKPRDAVWNHSVVHWVVELFPIAMGNLQRYLEFAKVCLRNNMKNVLEKTKTLVRNTS